MGTPCLGADLLEDVSMWLKAGCENKARGLVQTTSKTILGLTLRLHKCNMPGLCSYHSTFEEFKGKRSAN